MNYQNPTPNSELQQRVSEANLHIGKLINNIEHVIKGKRTVIENVVISMLANGHVLLLDVPGVGKTILSRAIAKSIATDFKRIQFTPDLLPTDITGVSIFNPKDREFEFKQGPVFTNILLADEINRASSKTQSALLEAMEERQVTMDNVVYKLPEFYFVIATQNPLEHAGTYPLPAAQLDRFLMRLSMGYPDKSVEKEILSSHSGNIKPLEEISAVVNTDQFVAWQKLNNEVYVSPAIDEYIVNLGEATRQSAAAGNGVSTRALLMLKRAARATALINNRDYVIPDDIHRIIRLVFSHRMFGSNKVGEAVIEEIVQKVAII